jgi:hypothetical protein
MDLTKDKTNSMLFLLQITIVFVNSRDEEII